MSRGDRDPHRTPKGRPYEKRACTRKVRYSRIGAQLKASRLDDMTFYRCPFCRGYHLAKKKRKR